MAVTYLGSQQGRRRAIIPTLI